MNSQRMLISLIYFRKYSNGGFGINLCYSFFYNLHIHFDMYLYICVISDDIKERLFHVAIEELL